MLLSFYVAYDDTAYFILLYRVLTGGKIDSKEAFWIPQLRLHTITMKFLPLSLLLFVCLINASVITSTLLSLRYRISILLLILYNLINQRPHDVNPHSLAMLIPTALR